MISKKSPEKFPFEKNQKIFKNILSSEKISKKSRKNPHLENNVENIPEKFLNLKKFLNIPSSNKISEKS